MKIAVTTSNFGMRNAMFCERNCTVIVKVLFLLWLPCIYSLWPFLQDVSSCILIVAVVLIGRVQSKKSMRTLICLALTILWSPRNLHQRRWESEGENIDSITDAGYFALNYVTLKKIFVILIIRLNR